VFRLQRSWAGIYVLALAFFVCIQERASAATVHQVCSDLIVVEVPTTTYGWQSTGINITANSKWYFTVQGIANVAWTVGTTNWDRWATPGGEPARLPINLTGPNILVPTAPVGSLVARIGGPTGTTLYLGGGGAIPPPYAQTPAISGPLELAYNDSNSEGNINSFLVVMHCYGGDCACTPPPSAVPPAEDQSNNSLLIDSNSPNPVQSSTSIGFTVPSAGTYRIGIFDVGGRLVRELLAGRLETGSQSVLWDARDDNGQKVGSGVYFCRMIGDAVEADRKLVVVK